MRTSAELSTKLILLAARAITAGAYDLAELLLDSSETLDKAEILIAKMRTGLS